MASAVEGLCELARAENRFDIPYAELRDQQVEAVNERFLSRRDHIRLLAHRTNQAGLTKISCLEDIVPVLFPHTAYKSYPESFLMEEQWDKLNKWLGTVSAYPVPYFEPTQIKDVDDWIAKLGEHGLHVSCSSGTTGKSAMLVASQKDMDWIKQDAVASLCWDLDLTPSRDRRYFALAPVASVPRNIVTAAAWQAAFQDPNHAPFEYPVPPITVGSLTQMVVLRKKIAEGTATPSDLQAFETMSATRQKAMDDALETTCRALVDARHEKLHITGLWAGIYGVARAVRDMGYSGEDFNTQNSMYAGGGLKGAALPDDYREFVYETFNVSDDNIRLNYGMQELHTTFPRCRQGKRYHLPPWVVPLILDQGGDNLLPIIDGEYEGRASFFDLSIDGRWGGIISGDKVAIDFSPCACGARGPSIRDSVVRYTDLQEGDDKIGCAGTIDAYVRGVS